MTPDLSQAALDNGITTLFGGGTGTANGTRSATCNPGAWYTPSDAQAVDNEPVNYGLMAKGSGDRPELIGEQIEAGCAAIKTHEDWVQLQPELKTQLLLLTSMMFNTLSTLTP